MLRTVDPGQHYHFGLQNSIKSLLNFFSEINQFNTIKLLFNIDGLPLSKSSSSQFYPTLCALFENIQKVDVVGIYPGYISLIILIHLCQSL